jgi:hypothetical protein
VTRLLPVFAALLVIGPAGSARAQEGGDALAQGLAAYRSLDYDRAATLLRQALGARGSAAFPDSVRAEAAVYLGATERFRGRLDSAAAAFRRAVAADPRHRADTLVFPPEIVQAFEAARRSTQYVHVRTALDTTITAGGGAYVVRLYASAPHDLAVTLRSERGGDARRLYAGPIGDSLAVTWDGLDAGGRHPMEGALVLEVASGTTRQRPSVVRVPITARVTGADSLALPPVPDSLLLPERESAGPAVRALVAGLLGGVAALALPAAVSPGEPGEPGRYGVGAALTLAGVVGFIVHRPGRQIPDGVAANRATREAWRRDAEAARDARGERRTGVTLRVSAGRQTAFAGGEP